ncbi:glycoside hydrolase family 2 TIM barrel-domain containing protein [Amycolatopsis carbonis]|uniref:Glycoside hydrolase family 2 TIM barrel-domain containing protein n=1 Tax=Amycolatopsis carbonis TaxID=715471 RepID=A0A9Y2IHL6_9PSEU|nr:sugar-binding domain-containing protein [Amycolatopsis sp. 2-15]WIX79426.1 glycoside hydrolase family 2 TIM barrel-domain containing protein [Amycolatopsis sp. 2-15]
MVRPAVVLAVLLFGLSGVPPVAQPQWHRETPPLSTPWTDAVSPTNALPEYPRPQLTRDAWQNLNGVWEFEPAHTVEPPFGRQLREQILVPYPVESSLSGIMRHETRMWYRRTFDIPESWRSRRTVLHFQAVDHDATVYVNGHEVTHHTGGYDSFTADITDALTTGPQELVVGVTDPTGNGQPLGKQRAPGAGVFYTPSSGIWQTVWLEPVAPVHITRVDTTSNPATGEVTLTVQGADGTPFRVTASDHGHVVAQAEGTAGHPLTFTVGHPHLWSPDDPFLYDLRVTLSTGDTVGSYFGLRSIAVENHRLLLNGKPFVQLGPLDQGFWPDGLYTAPTDAALEFDLQQEKALGFTMVRKHLKVEPDRWYYHADRLGLLVWQDMPAMPENVTPTPQARANFETELHHVIDQHRSFPSIVTWVPFNEGWGDFDVARVADEIAAWDPTRLVDAESGVNCCRSQPDTGHGDLLDDHTYPGPGTPPPDPVRATVDGEYGGLGLRVRGHEFDPSGSFAYELEPDSAALTRRYVELQQQLATVVRRGLSAAVYTQLTDVEKEVNGFLTYDRRVRKLDFAVARRANLAVRSAAR